MSNQLKSTPLQIAEYIKDEIELGMLKPGDKLPSERELVKKLSVSRSSVREAIKYLSTMEYLESFKRKGTFVSKKYIENKYANAQLNNILKFAPIFDLMEVRMFLEEQFIVLAVKRATDSDIEKLNKVLDKIKKENDNTDFLKADLEFHLTLAESTHNVVIVELMKVIIKRIYDNAEAFIESSSKTREITINTFTEIVLQIEMRNVGTAELLYHNHIHLVDDILKDQLLK
jgi:DNA-binding FadR family transcriptional regulator